MRRQRKKQKRKERNEIKKKQKLVLVNFQACHLIFRPSLDPVLPNSARTHGLDASERIRPHVADREGTRLCKRGALLTPRLGCLVHQTGTKHLQMRRRALLVKLWSSTVSVLLVYSIMYARVRTDVAPPNDRARAFLGLRGQRSG